MSPCWAVLKNANVVVKMVSVVSKEEGVEVFVVTVVTRLMEQTMLSCIRVFYMSLAD
jgi:hypothetical protein